MVKKVADTGRLKYMPSSCISNISAVKMAILEVIYRCIAIPLNILMTFFTEIDSIIMVSSYICIIIPHSHYFSDHPLPFPIPHPLLQLVPLCVYVVIYVRA